MVCFKFTNANLTRFINILDKSQFPEKQNFVIQLAKLCYRKNLELTPFVKFLNASDLVEMQNIRPEFQRLNQHIYLNYPYLYQYMMSNHLAEMLKLPQHLFIDDKDIDANSNCYYEIKINGDTCQLVHVNAVRSKIQNTTDYQRIAFKLVKYRGRNPKLKDMYQVTYAYACDLMMTELQTYLDQKISDVPINHVCNPYLVQYYHNFDNDYSVTQMRTQTQKSLNSKRCHIDHTLLISEPLAQNLMQKANLLGCDHSQKWTGVVNGKIKQRKHKSANVTFKKTLISYDDEVESFYLDISKVHQLEYPTIAFQPDLHEQFIKESIHQEKYAKSGTTKKSIINQYDYIFQSIIPLCD